MFSPLLSLLLVPFLVAMFLAMNMGASGTSPSFSAAYGANLLPREAIPGLFGTFVFLGAILAGKKVTLTIGGGILPGEIMGLPLTTVILLAIALSLLMANLLRVPQSTSQSTVFALIGSALYLNMLHTRKLFLEIIPTWFILPIVSFLITLFIGEFLYNPLRRCGRMRFADLGRRPLLRVVVVAVSCYVAFAIGSNNVANAAGPLTSMLMNDLNIQPGGEGSTLVMLLAMLVVAPHFGVGSSLLGHRVVHTTGKEIVEFGPLGATLIAVVTASLLLLASVSRGIPTSLVQMNTAAIIGLGISKLGWREIITRSAVMRLLTIWILAPLVAMTLAFLFTMVVDRVGWIAWPTAAP